MLRSATGASSFEAQTRRLARPQNICIPRLAHVLVNQHRFIVRPQAGLRTRLSNASYSSRHVNYIPVAMHFEKGQMRVLGSAASTSGVFRKLWKIIAVAFVAVVLSMAARDVMLPGGGAVKFNIQQQPLSSALNEFAIQSHEQIMFATSITDGKMTRGLRGELAPTVALRRLLANTGLVASRMSNGMFMVSKAEAHAAGD